MYKINLVNLIYLKRKEKNIFKLKKRLSDYLEKAQNNYLYYSNLQQIQEQQQVQQQALAQLQNQYRAQEEEINQLEQQIPQIPEQEPQTVFMVEENETIDVIKLINLFDLKQDPYSKYV